MKLNFKTALTDNNIKIVCNRMKIPLIGVFMDDELPDRYKDGNYIVNLESSYQSGSHWVAFIKEKGSIYYFDPFGVYPDQPLYENWMKNNYMIYMNDRDLQSISSILCGYFCIGLFLYMKLNTDKRTTFQKFESYFRMFNYKNTKLNDKIIKDYISNYFS